jgi:hypothetical protein
VKAVNKRAILVTKVKLSDKVDPETQEPMVEESPDARLPDDFSSTPTTPRSETDSLGGYHSFKTLVHFHKFLEFIDSYLAKPLQLYRRLQTGHEDRIAFENMWMLFDQGNDIYCPSHTGGLPIPLRGSGLPMGPGMRNEDLHIPKPRYVPQLFRVLGTTGGIPKAHTLGIPTASVHRSAFDKAPPYQSFGSTNLPSRQKQHTWSRNFPTSYLWRTRNRYTPFFVICFHIDFDGLKYGTVREVFVFKPHDGLVDIKSLAVFPIQYLKPELSRSLKSTTEDEPDILLERGRKFLDVTAMAHMWYEGLTIGKGRQEVNLLI